MAEITAQAAFRMDRADFDIAVRSQVGFEFYDNAYESYGRSTYEDIALVQYGRRHPDRRLRRQRPQ